MGVESTLAVCSVKTVEPPSSSSCVSGRDDTKQTPENRHMQSIFEEASKMADIHVGLSPPATKKRCKVVDLSSDDELTSIDVKFIHACKKKFMSTSLAFQSS